MNEWRPIPKPKSLEWPPRPVDADAPDIPGYWKRPGASPDQVIDAELPTRSPAALDAARLGAPASSERVSFMDRLRDAWREIETEWLGRTSATFAERAREIGWCGDLPGDSCPRCATSLGPFELIDRFTVSRCPACERSRLPWTRAIRLGEYRGLVRRAVHEIKFTRWRTLGLEVGRLLGAAVAAELERAKVPRESCVLIPVPTPWLRTMVRQIDHTAVIASGVSAVTGVRVSHMLSRLHRPPQTRVSSWERGRNVHGSFRAHPGRLPAGAKLAIVLDDVRTTGATLREACRTIKAAMQARDLELWVAVVGVTPDRRDKVRLEVGTGEVGEMANVSR